MKHYVHFLLSSGQSLSYIAKRLNVEDVYNVYMAAGWKQTSAKFWGFFANFKMFSPLSPSRLSQSTLFYLLSAVFSRLIEENLSWCKSILDRERSICQPTPETLPSRQQQSPAEKFKMFRSSKDANCRTNSLDAYVQEPPNEKPIALVKYSINQRPRHLSWYLLSAYNFKRKTITSPKARVRAFQM